MPPKLKPSGEVVQENEEVLGSDEAPVNGETGNVLKMVYVDGKNPEVRNIAVTNIGMENSDPAGLTD